MLEALLVTVDVKYERRYLKVFQESAIHAWAWQSGIGHADAGTGQVLRSSKKKSAHSRTAPGRRSLKSADPATSRCHSLQKVVVRAPGEKDPKPRSRRRHSPVGFEIDEGFVQ